MWQIVPSDYMETQYTNKVLRSPPLEQGESSSVQVAFIAETGSFSHEVTLSSDENQLVISVNGIPYIGLSGSVNAYPITISNFSDILEMSYDKEMSIEWTYEQISTHHKQYDFGQIDNLIFTSNMDSDDDQLNDAWELKYFYGLHQHTQGDLDEDGLSNLEEMKHRTNPALPDTDQDRLLDGWEVKHGLDPLVKNNDSAAIIRSHQSHSDIIYQKGLKALNNSDLETAKKYFKQAADEENYAPAQYKLAEMFENINGKIHFYYQANYYYKLAAEQEHIEALRKLARMAEENYDQNTNYYREQLAEKGYSESQFILAQLYENALSITEAKKWYQRAAFQGHKDAQEALIYTRPSCENVYSYDTTIDLNETESQYMGEGSTEEQRRYRHLTYYKNGRHYFCASGSPVNYEEAFLWFKKSSKYNRDAHAALAYMYHKGLYVAKDPQKALKHLIAAGEEYNTGFRYFYGIGLEKDMKKAFTYFEALAPESKVAQRQIEYMREQKLID